MKTFFERIYNGIIKENPTFILMLGMCPTLAVTSSAINGLGMGLSTTAVLIMSNIMISLLRKVIPDRVRIPAFIVVVASFVTIVQLLLQAYVKPVYDSLGIYIPLIVVNCIILGRAEAYASKHIPLASAGDGIGMGLGFTIALTLIGIVREFIGAGSFFGMEIAGLVDYSIGIFVMAPGAFFILAVLTALQNKFKAPSATNITGNTAIACGGNCANCTGATCQANHVKLAEAKAEEAARLAAEKAAKAEAAKKAAAAKAEKKED